MPAQPPSQPRANRTLRRRALYLAIAIASCIPASAQTPLQQQATTLGTDFFAGASSTGMVLVAVRNHEVAITGFGETAPGSRITPTQDSLLRLCSLSKIFATDLLIQLEHDGTVHLDDPLQRFAPPHAIVPSLAGREITLLDLATHTAGLPREVGNAPRGTPHFTFPDYTYRWHWLRTQRLHTAPGAAALYSNIGFDLLGDALQQATHEPYARLFAERIATPLGLRETGFTPTPAQCSHLLLSIHDEGPCTDTQSSAASAGVYSTGADIARWLQYLLFNQTADAQAIYIHPSALRSEQGLDHAGTPTGIGLGWMHLLPEGDPSAIIEKTGGGAGFVTYIALNPAHHTAIFFALTDGPPEPPNTASHPNVFKMANNLLLALNGLPPLPPDSPKPTRPARKRRAAKASHR